MRPDHEALSEREKEALRLLLAGHDAKSIARHLGRSVHTINERLREARRKLGVSSSREAARQLAEIEARHPEFSGYKNIGAAARAATAQPDHRRNRAVWIGGSVAMILVLAAVALSSVLPSSGSTPGSPVLTAPTMAGPDISSARRWLQLVDSGRWNESWRGAAESFQSQISESQWAAMVQPVRAPLGPVSSRELKSLTKLSSLPGLPPGDYETLQFQTDFARKMGAIETVGLAHENSGWKVIGYFIR